MKITKMDPVLGEEITLDIPITELEYERIINRYITNEYIQDIVPYLNEQYREFLISGISPKGWLKYLDACKELEDFIEERDD